MTTRRHLIPLVSELPLDLDIYGQLSMLVGTNEVLERYFNIPAGKVPAYRRRHTGTDRKTSRKWARTVGYWGGVALGRTISSETGIPLREVTNRQHGRCADLADLGRRELVHPSALARNVYESAHRRVDQVADTLGIMRVEAALYFLRFHELAEHLDVHPTALLDLSADELKREWEKAGMSIRMPSDFDDEMRKRFRKHNPDRQQGPGGGRPRRGGMAARVRKTRRRR